MLSWDAGVALLNPFVSTALLALGLFCMLTQKRVIKQVIGLNIMLQGALLSILEAGRANGTIESAQTLVVSALVVEAIVIAITLALIVNIYRHHPAGRVDDLNELRG